MSFTYSYPLEKLLAGATTALVGCMGYRPRESVLVLTDDLHRPIGQLFYDAARNVVQRAPLRIYKMQNTGGNGREPVDKDVSKLMREYDIVLIATRYSLTHTKARRDASKKGVRIASMPGITELSLAEGGMTADYKEVTRLTQEMYEAVRNGGLIRVYTKAGTDVQIKVGKYPWHLDTGIYHNKGEFGNLPAGEIYTAPFERGVNGKIVFDYMGSVIDSPATVYVKNGKIVSGDERVLRLANSVGHKGRQIAELGIGTNPGAIDTTSVLEAEKILGTAHAASGNNVFAGGNNDVPLHQDGIIKEPTVSLDGRWIMENGIWQI